MVTKLGRRKLLREVRLWGCAVGLVVLGANVLRAGELLVFRGGFSAADTLSAGLTVDALSTAAIPFREIGPGELAGELVATSGRGNILLLTHAPNFPAEAIGALRDYLRRGNHLIALSGPPLSRLFRNQEGTWEEVHRPADPPLVLESIAPTYKFHSSRGAALRRAGVAASVSFDGEILAALPRSPGFGSERLRKWRQIPLAHLLDQDGRELALAAHVLLNHESTYAGSAWAYIGLSPDDLARTRVSSGPLLIEMVRRLQAGVFLANAGAQDFAFPVGNPVRLGAYVANCNGRMGEAEVRFTVSRGREVMHSSAAKLALPEGETRTHFLPGEQLDLEAGEYEVSTTLALDGSVIDAIQYPFRVVQFAAPGAEDTVVVQGGDFVLRGEKWYPFGMNYWPRYIIGTEPEDFSDAQWDPSHYNPLSVEEDLALAARLGMNTISIQYNRIEQAGPLMDLLARAQRHRIKVHLFLPGIDPLQQDFPRASALIRAAHLAESPALFAYDLGWEVRVGPRTRRASSDAAWHDWVIDHYGDIEHAVADWGYRPEIVDGRLVGASDAQLIQDGPWRRYVAAYRRFWDDEISRCYREVRRFIRSLDPHHLIGARSGYGGTGGEWIADHFPFDLASGAKHLDFISPEHYETPKDRLEFLRGVFTTAYARLVSGGKPVYWAEYGKPVAWKTDALDYSLRADVTALRDQAGYFRGVLEMVHEGGANGCAGWWWPAGYRVDEKSDFGIVEPDLSLRPAAVALAQTARWFDQPRLLPPPQGELTIDRDDYVTGYGGIYRSYSSDYARLFTENSAPRLKTHGTGTDSASVPLVAVGGTPCDGRNPPKHLNAEFNFIRINGQSIKGGDVVVLPNDEPVVVEASIGNTAEATWLSRSKRELGSVHLSARAAEIVALGAIEQDTPFLHDAQVKSFQLLPRLDQPHTVTFRMTVIGRVEFGQVLRVKLQPSSADEDPVRSAR